ncbi:Na+/H+ antiporter NhaA [Cytophagaceae bacterium YF14B1]|uniref:Na(+)/H(+) antiporter NhaA n=1 Tax=Xanthocytophaga flava TaxID=3048013 RepID=A0AAE3QSS6_9BACT|nr:Na+/H+ antiporter NhaA [Xanthocytophaga flavus]MDJ1482743.1 Na+/H+ antiporter NhaA [Xanthocytophaga flavus]
MSNSVKKRIHPLVKPFSDFIQSETSGGIILLIVSVLSLILANMDQGIARYFPAIWESHFHISFNGFEMNKSLTHWINDGLMALFFLVVGLEIKREILEGELSSIKKAALPMISALGGMVVPAILFALINWNAPTRSGWGIPMATDIAFALAVLLLLGDKIPLSLKIFLTALAIVDDLGAVIVIAVFYTSQLDFTYLLYAALTWGVLLALNKAGVRTLSIYLLIGLFLWYFILQSGIHATIAGVLLAISIPFRIRYPKNQLVEMIDDRLQIIKDNLHSEQLQPRTISEELEDLNEKINSPAQRLEHQLHPLIAFLIIPLFAFCNTSLLINTDVFHQVFSPIGVGIMVGLVAGKPLGICLFAYFSVRLGWAALPAGVSWKQLIGAGILGGIGFTMSIFITLLAFENNPEFQSVAKVSILLASLIAGLTGYFLLRGQKLLPVVATTSDEQ